jgi:hypothetical protein
MIILGNGILTAGVRNMLKRYPAKDNREIFIKMPTNYG